MPLRTEQPETTTKKFYGTEMLPDEYRVMYEVEDEFWWYIGMRHNLFALLQKYWDWSVQSEPRILDAGCGTGANLQQLVGCFGGRLNTGNAWGFDVSAEALHFSQKRGLENRVVQGSITEIPYASNSFDIAVSFDVLNNLPDDRRGFREIARVLRHEGLFILNLPAYQFLYGKHDQAIGGKRRYNRKQVAARLAEAGMKVERSTYLNTVLFPPAALVRFLNRGQTHQEVHSDLTLPSDTINHLLAKTMSVEAEVLRHTNWNLPLGLSVMTVARKL
ncbi:MAG: class I SAM-dependent methyltransferase [Chloroflexi bacterium]|nr:class I SAM-dependent methyltransferase [Chloroflexota bacterium]